MNTVARVEDERPLVESATGRVARYDWTRVSTELGAYGWAALERILTPEECRAVAALYPKEGHFRSHIVMARHGFGRGEYRYFASPLPDLVQQLRQALYPRLAPIANEWNAQMGVTRRYPDAHAEFLRQCHEAGQSRPTPLLLQYGEGDYTIASTRISMATSPFRSRSRFCCPRRVVTSPAASLP